MAERIEKRTRRRRVPDDVLVDRPVAAWANDYAAGIRLAPHRHSRGQLVFAASGVMNVTTAQGTWVVPPSRAVWVPAAVEHAIAMSGTVAMRTVYVRKEAARGLPKAPCVLSVSPLLRELILRAMALPPLYRPRSAAGRVMGLILDEIRSLPVMPLELRMPRDPRLLRLCSIVLDDPGGTEGFERLARKSGASTRTLARLFRRETGLSFTRWRQQARLMEALRRLAAGAPITVVALDLGYATPSAFTYMFRRALGVPPSRFYAAAAA
jgi:AraC-like DNA-binding protein